MVNNNYYYQYITAGIFGGMAGCFLVALIIGGIYSLITIKNHPKEEFSYRSRKAIAVVYWIYMPVYYLFLYRTTVYEPQSYRFGLFFASALVSLAIWGLYRFIRAIVGSKSSNEKTTTHQTSNARITNQNINLVEGENKVILGHSSNLSESEEYWGLISFAYGKIKQTSIFKLWRREQFDCQFGKCAICGKPMGIKSNEVDHIKPRYKKGTNYSNNLELVCKKCNQDKGAKTGFEKPTWIKDNKYSEKFDEKVYEITEAIRAEYPTKFPDELFIKPTSQE